MRTLSVNFSDWAIFFLRDRFEHESLTWGKEAVY